MTRVSVIGPNYNHARFLRQRLDSILAQTFQDFELILLDDCSTDESRSIISEYAKNPQVRTEFNDANSGSPFKQWNKGVRLAQGDYVWIAESDDYAENLFLERLVGILDGDKEVTFAYCRSREVSDQGQLLGLLSCPLKQRPKQERPHAHRPGRRGSAAGDPLDHAASYAERGNAEDRKILASGYWPWAMLSRSVPQNVKLKIWRDAMEIDPHPVLRIIQAMMTMVRLKARKEFRLFRQRFDSPPS